MNPIPIFTVEWENSKVIYSPSCYRIGQSLVWQCCTDSLFLSRLNSLLTDVNSFVTSSSPMHRTPTNCATWWWLHINEYSVIAESVISASPYRKHFIQSSSNQLHGSAIWCNIYAREPRIIRNAPASTSFEAIHPRRPMLQLQVNKTVDHCASRLTMRDEVDNYMIRPQSTLTSILHKIHDSIILFGSIVRNRWRVLWTAVQQTPPASQKVVSNSWESIPQSVSAL